MCPRSENSKNPNNDNRAKDADTPIEAKLEMFMILS